MNQLIITLLFFCISNISYSQFCEYLVGCNNQKAKRAKELCKPKTFNELFSLEMGKIIEDYGDKVPTGKANIQFTIRKMDQLM